MAEEKFPYLKQAHALFHTKPRPANLADKLEELAQKAGGTTVEARMIGSLVSAAWMDEMNGHV
ncbi:hypothetical protein [Superficieibacter sp. 1612_C1]|uniref:hypothetical protein n=1 Tax=Superficieibacter sp. 1612_C1 TaxID=2780382 RepID=UPI00188337BE|nr:hypothetical protein [Superficieibacter sp. 1612_C1]